MQFLQDHLPLILEILAAIVGILFARYHVNEWIKEKANAKTYALYLLVRNAVVQVYHDYVQTEKQKASTLNTTKLTTQAKAAAREKAMEIIKTKAKEVKLPEKLVTEMAPTFIETAVNELKSSAKGNTKDVLISTGVNLATKGIIAGLKKLF